MPTRSGLTARILAAGAIVIALSVAALLVVFSPTAAASEGNDGCLVCHSAEVNAIELADSLHGSLECTSCHAGRAVPHDQMDAEADAASTVLMMQSCESCHSAAAEEYRGSDNVHSTLAPGGPSCSDCHGSHAISGAPETPEEAAAVCSTCHASASNRLTVSVHGGLPATDRGDGGPGSMVPACTDCHGSHMVPEAGAIEAAMCASCHFAAVDNYEDSVHGMALINGEPDVATCGDCHGPLHGMVPTADANSPLYSLNLPQTCARCHADEELAARHNIDVANAYQLYMDSIHGHALWESGLLVAAGCSECHGTHDILAKEDPDSSVNRAAIPETCGACHAGILADYEVSIHGTMLAAGIASAPTCTDCHSAHEIAEVDEAESQLRIVGECGDCHKESQETFSDTFHGQISDLGYTSAAQCSDCHGSHDILPASHPDSRVADGNLKATCRQCHESANDNFVMYSPHADADDREANPGLYWLKKFMETLIIGVFVVFGIHTLLWTTRSLIARRRGEPGDPPLEGIER